MDIETFTDRFEPRLALASMSGESSAEWAMAREEWIGGAFLGAFNLDEETCTASREMVARGRTEFLPDRPFDYLDDQLEKCAEIDCLVGANVRTVSPERIHRAGELCVEHDVVLEINAHCRQPEMVEIGCGQQLLRTPERLRDYLQAGSESGALVSLKGRFEVEDADSVEILNRAVEWGADILHVDAMDSEGLIAELEAPFILANNGVRRARHVREYARYGADGVSVGRANNPDFLETLSKAVRNQWEPNNQETIPSAAPKMSG